MPQTEIRKTNESKKSRTEGKENRERKKRKGKKACVQDGKGCINEIKKETER